MLAATTTLETPIARLAGLIAWLAERIAGLCDQAGRDHAGRGQAGGDQARRGQAEGDHVGGDPARREQAGAPRARPDQAGLTPAHAGALLARLRHLLARFGAVAATPIPPAKPARKPPEPRFVPTHSFRLASADPPPARPGLPRSWRWLPRVVPQAAAACTQLEELLREPALRERLAGDPRLGRALRPLGWMLGVERALLPPGRWRRRVVILVPGGRAQAAQAAADYAAARANGVSWADLLALGCSPPEGGRDRRPVWRGCAGLVPKGGAKSPG